MLLAGRGLTSGKGRADARADAGRILAAIP